MLLKLVLVNEENDLNIRRMKLTPFSIGLILFTGVYQNSCRSLYEKNNDLPLDDRIIYVFPDSVETGVNQYFLHVQEYRKNMNFNNFCGYLDRGETVDIYKLVIFEYRDDQTPKDDDVVRRVNKSNRYFVVNNRLIPLVFESDFDFGSVGPIANTGEMGDRYMNFYKFRLILEDANPCFYFNTDNKLINKH